VSNLDDLMVPAYAVRIRDAVLIDVVQVHRQA